MACDAPADLSDGHGGGFAFDLGDVLVGEF
jgi:hypothetical protein